MAETKIIPSAPFSLPAPDISFYDSAYGCHYGFNERQLKFSQHHGFEYASRGNDFFSMESPGTLNTFPIFRRDHLGFRRAYPPPKRSLYPQKPPQPPQRPQTVPTFSEGYPRTARRVPHLDLRRATPPTGSQTSRPYRSQARGIAQYTPRTFTPAAFTTRYR